MKIQRMIEICDNKKNRVILSVLLFVAMVLPVKTSSLNLPLVAHSIPIQEQIGGRFCLFADSVCNVGIFDMKQQIITVPPIYHKIKPIGRGYYAVIDLEWLKLNLPALVGDVNKFDSEWERALNPYQNVIDSLGNKIGPNEGNHDYRWLSPNIIWRVGWEYDQHYFNTKSKKWFYFSPPTLFDTEKWGMLQLENAGDDDLVVAYQWNSGKMLKFDFDCNEVVPAMYDSIGASHHGLSVFFVREQLLENKQTQESKLYGYINSKGETIIEPSFYDARDFHEGYATVKNSQNKWGLIDTLGTIALPFSAVEPIDVQSGYAVLQESVSNYRIINLNTKYSFLCRCDEIKPLGYGYFKTRHGQQKFVIGTSGLVLREVNDIEFDSLQTIEYMLPVGNHFVDNTGHQISLPIEVDCCGPFSGSVALVMKDGKYGLIDKSFQLIVPIVFDSIYKYYQESRTLIALQNGEIVMRQY